MLGRDHREIKVRDDENHRVLFYALVTVKLPNRDQNRVSHWTLTTL
jgi:hypothetical protein